MIPRSAAQLAEVTGGELTGVRPDALVTGVVTDSRLAEAGSLFVALAGEHVDGHDYADVAVAQGASLVLATRPLGEAEAALPTLVVPDVAAALGELARHVLAVLREKGDLQVLAMTGSVGKTTTKDLLAQVLASVAPTVAPVRSFNNEIGLPLTVLRADERTRYLVLEMGASGIGHIEYLTRIAPPDAGAVLMVGSAHVGEFGGVAAIARAKSEIVTGLAPGGVAVLNADDPLVAPMADRARGAVLTFGQDAKALVRAEDVRAREGARVAFTLVDGRGETDVRVPVALRLAGEHHLGNALAAAALALQAGLDAPTVAAQLSEATALSPHRMHVVDRSDGVTIIDDSYNANPDSMRAALKALVSFAPGRRTVAVLGEMLEMGEESVSAHDELGRLAVRLNVNLLLVVGRGARPIFTGAVQEGSWDDEAQFVPDLDAARTWLTDELTAGDVVLVKSSNGSGLWRLADWLIEGGPA